MQLVAAIMVLGSLSAMGSELPSASGDVTSQECRDAMALARSMFVSTAPTLYAPMQLPPEMRSRMILGSRDTDLTGGDALQPSDNFDSVPNTIGQSVYWSARVDEGGLRIVVTSDEVGWRGAKYSLYMIDRGIDSSDFIRSFQRNGANSRFTPILYGSWRPPLVFRIPEPGNSWFITVGEPYQVLADWVVYTSTGTSPICTIAFRDPAQSSSHRLPEAVRSLARQLDEALGPDNEPGTLHPITRLRIESRRVLANAAYRPWALWDGDAYNSREEVDAGLERWAKISDSQRLLHEEIRSTYPKAQSSLAVWYQDRFGLDPTKAKETSAWTLDLIFRSFFTFSNGVSLRYEGVRTNPWPEQTAIRDDS